MTVTGQKVASIREPLVAKRCRAGKNGARANALPHCMREKTHFFFDCMHPWRDQLQKSKPVFYRTKIFFLVSIGFQIAKIFQFFFFKGLDPFHPNLP